MTTVGQVNLELKVMETSSEKAGVQGSDADTKLREAFGTNGEQGSTKPQSLKAQELNYEGFPKANRLDASEFAGRSLNEVKDAAREFNADFPETPYVIDYSEFPRPEHYDKKNYGGKDKAYNAWKDAVTEWVEDCKQDMVTRKSSHISSMTEKFERAMNNGFFNIYLQMGITREFIQATYEALQGNINSVKAQLDAKAAEIKKHTSRVGNSVVNNVNANTNSRVAGLHEHLDYNTYELHAHINYATQELGERIEQGVQDVNANTDNRAKEIQETVTSESEKIQKQNENSRQISALSDAISAALHGWHDGFRTVETLNNVEQLKLEIITSNKVGDNKKIELLNKLLNLINTDGWITDGDLEEIVTEARRII